MADQLDHKGRAALRLDVAEHAAVSLCQLTRNGQANAAAARR